MSQTQLASMFLGNPYAHDRDERLKGVSSQLNASIIIIDGQSYNGEILDYITAKNIIDDTHKKSLEDTLETYQFITFADRRYTEFLEKRNRLIIPDEDGTPIEFTIFEAHKYLDSEGRKAQVFAHASYLELKKASIIYPGSFKGTASQHGGRVLNGTGWQIGTVEASGNITIGNENHSNPYEMLRRIAKEFGVELRFRVECNGNKIVGRYVDLLQRVGEWRGRLIEFGKDLDSIRRVEKQNVVTALLGLGPEDENGNRIEVLVEDEEALQRWGWIDEHGKLNHLIEPYEIQSTRESMTVTEARRYTRTALDKRINTQVTYEATIVDLENAPGMQNKKIRFGDTIRIKDTKFNPPLYLEARVFEQDRSIKSRAKKDIKLGDFVEFTEEEVNAMWIMLQREIRKKIDIETLKEYAEPKKIESDTPPEIKDEENPIWVDTSRTPHVSHVVNGGEWVKMTPTTPEEVDAYNKQQVDKKDEDALNEAKEDATQKANNAQSEAERKAAEDALEKAEQALADAKAFAKNAENITEGVVDVGAVPLRTSATGARLEWDGVNGFMQYDSAGKPVSWFNLDGDGYLSNITVSGRVEALEGFFAGELRGVSGTFDKVTANENGFHFESEESGELMVTTNLNNYIVNHAFNYLVPDWSKNYTSGAIGVLEGGNPNSKIGWNVVGSCRMFNDANPGLFGYTERLAMFGLKSLVVDEEGYMWQEISLAAGETYTYSAHIKRPKGYNSGAGVRIRVIAYKGSHVEVERFDKEESVPANVNAIKRIANTFTVPSDAEYVRVYVRGTNTRFAQIDGMQLVKGEYMAPYNDESELAYIGHGLSRAEKIIVSDGIDSKGYSEFMGFSSMGDATFHKGMVFVSDWWRNTSSNSVNARVSYDSSVGTSTTTLYRVTSAKKYKKDIQSMDIDPYLILKAVPKMWLDKGEIERNGNSKSGVNYSYGLIADEIAEIGLSEFVDYMEGEIEGLQYDRLWILLIPLIKDLFKEASMLKSEVSSLKEDMDQLKNIIS